MEQVTKNTLINKIDYLREELSKCKKQLKQLQKDLIDKTSSTCKDCDAFRNAVVYDGGSSQPHHHKHKKRRLNRSRAKTPNNFYSINNF